MSEDPLDVIDRNLSNLRESVRLHVAERLDAGGSIVSVADGKVVAKSKVAGKITKTILGDVKRPPPTRRSRAESKMPVCLRLDPMFAEEPAAAL